MILHTMAFPEVGALRRAKCCKTTPKKIPQKGFVLCSLFTVASRPQRRPGTTSLGGRDHPIGNPLSFLLILETIVRPECRWHGRLTVFLFSPHRRSIRRCSASGPALAAGCCVWCCAARTARARPRPPPRRPRPPLPALPAPYRCARSPVRCTLF